MKLSKLVLGSLVAASVALPAAASAQTDPDTRVVDAFNDPAFWSIVEAGPSDSRELERIVTTYAANDMPEQATDVLFDYLVDNVGDFGARCAYCVMLLSDVHTPRESDVVPLLLDAMDRVMARFLEQGSARGLLDLAQLITASKNHANAGRAWYYMVNAANLGIDDEAKFEVVMFLADVGRLADARRLAEAISTDERSVHYRSQAVQRWIAWLDSEIARHDALAAKMTAAAGR